MSQTDEVAVTPRPPNLHEQSPFDSQNCVTLFWNNSQQHARFALPLGGVREAESFLPLLIASQSSQHPPQTSNEPPKHSNPSGLLSAEGQIPLLPPNNLISRSPAHSTPSEAHLLCAAGAHVHFRAALSYCSHLLNTLPPPLRTVWQKQNQDWTQKQRKRLRIVP